MFNWLYDLTDRVRMLPADCRSWLLDLRCRCTPGRLAVIGVVGSFIASVGFIVHLVHSGYVQRYAEEQRRTDLRCLAENIYHEARGEPYEGRIAVAEVTMNRVASPPFPNEVCAVVHQITRHVATRQKVAAFSWTLEETRRPRGRAWQEAQRIAAQVYDGEHTPVLPEALHYHATYIEPHWARRMSPLRTIGNHVFYP